MKEKIVYVGSQFVIEWYEDVRGRSQARDHYESLDDRKRKRAFGLFRVMGEVGRIHDETKFRHEGHQIYVFKAGPERFFAFFFVGRRIIVTNAYEKQRQKMPVIEMRKAEWARADWIERFGK